MLEDDSDDRYLTEETLRHFGLNLQLTFYHTSEEMFAGIRQTQPDLILIDDNATPDASLEILRRLKQAENFRHLPVVVLSDSQLPNHREACYREGAASFVVKPRSLDETRNKINAFFRYWMEVAEC